MGQVIAVDFDDVIFDCNATLAEYHNATYETNYAPADMTSWQLEDTWGCTLDEAVRRVGEYLKTEFHNQAPLIEGASEGLKELKRLGYRIVLVTSRADDVRPQTEAWIARNIEGSFDEMHFINHFDASTPRFWSKADVCREIGAGVLLEDAVHHSENVAGSGILVLLFDAPWNQEEQEHERIIRVKDWPEALAWIKKNLPN